MEKENKKEIKGKKNIQITSHQNLPEHANFFNLVFIYATWLDWGLLWQNSLLYAFKLFRTSVANNNSRYGYFSIYQGWLRFQQIFCSLMIKPLKCHFKKPRFDNIKEVEKLQFTVYPSIINFKSNKIQSR